MTTRKGTIMSSTPHDENKRPAGRPRKYAGTQKARNVVIHDDVGFWLTTTSVSTGIPVSTLINSIIRSYILAAGSDVRVLPSWPAREVNMGDR